jgi:tripartite-type tricarboxylate transporter receptor subunit TctC
MRPGVRALQVALTIAVASSIMALWPAPGLAQAVDSPVRMLVGFPPGQATDLIARALARRLGTELGQTVIVDNKPGQGGSLALGALVNAPADGSVITLSALAAYAINPHLYKSVPYDPLRDLAPVGLVADIPTVLVAHASFEPANFEQFVSYARARPGKLLHSSSGNGTVSHLGMQELKQRAGLDIVHVPYQGSPRAMADIASGAVQVGLDSVAATRAMIEAGRIKVLAVASAERLPMFPDVPTIAESGYPGFAVSAWTGVSLPAGASPAVRQRLSQALMRITRSPEFAAELRALGATPRTSTVAEFETFLRAELARWGVAVRATNATVE